MDIISMLIFLVVNVLCFTGGVMLANKYHENNKVDIKDALEKQYMRLRAGADWNDPAGGYMAPREHRFTEQLKPLKDEFEEFGDKETWKNVSKSSDTPTRASRA